MPRILRAKEHKCEKCGKAFSSLMRLGHHQAAQHAANTLKGTRTLKNISLDGRGGGGADVIYDSC